MRIGEVAKITGLTEHTLRFYEKSGLMPDTAKRRGGIRDYCDTDIERLGIIECLKKTGMPLRDIKTFMQWCAQGDASIEQRYQMFIQRKEIVRQQMAELKKTMAVIDFKIKYYGDARDAGTLDIYKDKKIKKPVFF
ncbi:MAG: MerR family transcriptional regulator [Alphaproteobacteria bacterium]|nr:MerR family transcriptional regulator [Alphaproteobacteria bacterium]